MNEMTSVEISSYYIRQAQFGVVPSKLDHFSQHLQHSAEPHHIL